jgi:hypothetical protein
MRNLVLILTMAQFVGVVVAQNKDTYSDVSKTLDGMNARTWVLRERAFRTMPDLAEVSKKNADEADRLKLALIGLLSTENVAEQEFIVKGTTFATEEHSEYYASLVARVANLNDERAIPALVGAITTGGMATRGLARFGDKAIDPVLNLLQAPANPHSRVRSSAVFTIRDLLMLHIPITLTSHTRIKQALESALNDPEFGVRYSAICAIEYLEDREDLLPALKDMAEHDHGENPGTPYEHTLRPTAEQLVQKIANHQKPSAR